MILDDVDNYITIKNVSVENKNKFYKKYIDKKENIIDFEKVIKAKDNKKDFAYDYDLFETHDIWGSSINCETVTHDEEDNFNYDEDNKIISMQIKTFYATRIDDDYAFLLFPGVPWQILKKLSEDPILKDCTIEDTVYDINRWFVGTIAYLNGKLILNVLKRINPKDEEEISKIYDDCGYSYNLDEAIKENREYKNPNMVNINAILYVELDNKNINGFLNRYCTDFNNLVMILKV